MYTKNYLTSLFCSLRVVKNLKTSFNIIIIFLLCSSRLWAQPEIILNTTGYGFNKDSDNGINPDQWNYIQKFARLTFNNEDASISAVRLHIEWNQYEPEVGQYQGAKIIKAVEAIISLKPGMKVALHFPYNRPGAWNDKYFNAEDIARTKNNTLVQSDIAYTCPSIYSDYAQDRFYKFVDHVMSQLTKYYPNILYVEMGNSQAEEFAIPFNNISSGPDPGLYETKAQQSWNTKFLPLRFPNKKAVWNGQTFDTNTAYQPQDGDYYNSERSRDLHRFAGWGLMNKFNGFYKIIKSHSPKMKVLYFISDFGTQQGNIAFLHNSTLPLALELADGIYTSDGTTQWDIWKKIAALDVIKGTNPDKIAAIEFDPEDLGETRGGSSIDGGIPYEWMPRAYKHGADYIHIAMHYSDGEISQLSQTIHLLRQTFVGKPYKAPAREAAVPANIYPKVFTDQFLFSQWNDVGGSSWGVTDNKPKSIKMSDDGYWDNIWDNSPNMLPCNFSVQAASSNAKPSAGSKTTLSVSCEGKECGDTKFFWNGSGIANSTGSAIEITAPQAEGNYVYTVRTNRDGCASKVATTALAVGNPLPVTLVSFAAVKSEKVALLSWSTSAETNSDRFEVEQSAEGTTWQTLGSVQANGETSQTISKYSFTDQQPLNGENLYRLKMIDKDETFAYSRIRSLTFASESLAIAYPNPAINVLTITADDWSKIDKVQILSLSGNVIYESDNKAGPEINVSSLTPGSYVLRLLHTSGSQKTQKFIKRG